MIYEKKEFDGTFPSISKLNNIDREVKTVYGTGVVVAIEITPDTTENRYYIEITDESDYFKRVLISQFPDKQMCFWSWEIEWVDGKPEFSSPFYEEN